MLYRPQILLHTAPIATVPTTAGAVALSPPDRGGFRSTLLIEPVLAYERRRLQRMERIRDGSKVPAG